MTEPRRPLHLAVFLGVSASAYAVLLAGVTAEQARSDLAAFADRDPAAAMIAELGVAHDGLEAGIHRAAAAYARASSNYDAVGQGLADVEARLSDLADIVGSIEGTARDLPTRVPLPRVTASGPAVPRPVVHATTSASGG